MNEHKNQYSVMKLLLLIGIVVALFYPALTVLSLILPLMTGDSETQGDNALAFVASLYFTAPLTLLGILLIQKYKTWGQPSKKANPVLRPTVPDKPPTMLKYRVTQLVFIGSIIFVGYCLWQCAQLIRIDDGSGLGTMGAAFIFIFIILPALIVAYAMGKDWDKMSKLLNGATNPESKPNLPYTTNESKYVKTKPSADATVTNTQEISHEQNDSSPVKKD